MKSKYFIVSQNANGTFFIRSKNGRPIDCDAWSYEINLCQPKYIKVRHDRGQWCSLYHYRGRAAKETMWVSDVVLNDDGSYRVKEYQHETEWRYYDSPQKARSILKRCLLAAVSVAVSSGVFYLSFAEKSERHQQKQIDSLNKIPQQPVRVISPDLVKNNQTGQDKSRE